MESLCAFFIRMSSHSGRSSYTMVDNLGEMGVAVKIAPPNEVNAIARAKFNPDKRDSEVLAHLLRMNMVPEVYRGSQENRQAQLVLEKGTIVAGKYQIAELMGRGRMGILSPVGVAEEFSCLTEMRICRYHNLLRSRTCFSGIIHSFS